VKYCRLTESDLTGKICRKFENESDASTDLRFLRRTSLSACDPEALVGATSQVARPWLSPRPRDGEGRSVRIMARKRQMADRHSRTSPCERSSILVSDALQR